MDEGFLMLSRRFFLNEMWKVSREFSDCEAWLDLIQGARFESTQQTEKIGGREITYGRGQYPASVRFLSKRWKWGDQKVRTFIEKLEKKGMISTDSSQGINVITLIKYDEYNTTNNTTCNTVNNAPNKLINNELQEYATQQITQPVTQQITQSKSCEANNTFNILKNNELCNYVTQQKDNTVNNTPNKLINNELQEITTQQITQRKINNIYNNKNNIYNNLRSTNVLLCGIDEQSHSEKIDYAALVNYFNNETKGIFGTIRMPLSEKRKGMINARIKEHGKKTFIQMIKKAVLSNFLKGENSRNFIATFDWLIRPTNFEKVISGNYDNKTNKDDTETINTTSKEQRDKEFADHIFRKLNSS